MKLVQTASRPEANPVRVSPRTSGRPACCLALALMLLALVSCASQGAVKSGLSARYSTGLTLSLLTWRDGGSEYSGHPAEGRWLIADVRVDYDGNAQFAELPVSAIRVLWEAADGRRGESAALWVYDPTPGAGGVALRETLRVRISNRFVLAFDLPAAAVPVSLAVGSEVMPLYPVAPSP